MLIGLSGSGKSTVGRLLSERLACPLYDTDALLAERAGRSVPELLRADEAHFRALEEEVVAAACACTAGVIATGGGVVLSARNRAALRAGNWVVWLRAPSAALVARLRRGEGEFEERPLLDGDPMARLSALAGEREALYTASAHATVDTANQRIATVVQHVLDAYNRRERGSIRVT